MILLTVQEGLGGKHPRVLSLLSGCLVLAEPTGQCSPVMALPPGPLASVINAGPRSGIFLFLCKIQGKKITVPNRE